MPCAFLIDDDHASLTALQELMVRSFVPVKSCTNATAIVRDIARLQPFVILMSSSLFLQNKAALARQIRTHSHASILVYTHDKPSENLAHAIKQQHISDAVLVGNDQVELVKRVWCIVDKTLRALVTYQERQAHNALTNKTASLHPRTQIGSSSLHTRWLCCHRVFLDLLHGYVSFQGKSVQLTKNERTLLGLLMQHGGTVISRSEIQRYIWHSDAFIDDNTLTVNINRLRSALSKIGVPAGFLRTKRGVGYVVAADEHRR